MTTSGTRTSSRKNGNIPAGAAEPRPEWGAADLLGPPALIAGEDEAHYAELRDRVIEAVGPTDFLEEMWVRDIVDLRWQALRYRRLQANLLQAARHEGLDAGADAARRRSARGGRFGRTVGAPRGHRRAMRRARVSTSGASAGRSRPPRLGAPHCRGRDRSQPHPRRPPALSRAGSGRSRVRTGADRAQWTWGRAHFSDGEHRPFGLWPLIGSYFNIEVPSSGDDYTLNRGKMELGEEPPFANRHASSYRAIYDFADLDRSLYIQSTGQSGNPFSPFYRRFVERWAKGEYIRIPTKREEIVEAAQESGGSSRIQHCSARPHGGLPSV